MIFLRKSGQQMDSAFTTLSTFLSVTSLLYLYLGKKKLNLLHYSRTVGRWCLWICLLSWIRNWIMVCLATRYPSPKIYPCTLLPRIECIKEKKVVSHRRAGSANTPELCLLSLPAHIYRYVHGHTWLLTFCYSPCYRAATLSKNDFSNNSGTSLFA